MEKMQTLPEYVTVRGEPPRHTAGDPIKWSGDDAPPAIGAEVTVRSLGRAIVVGYFVEHGYLGLEIKLTKPPAWFTKQNGKGAVAHVYGAELVPALRPGLYRLAREVANPKPDKRKTSVWSAQPTIAAGIVFVVDERGYLKLGPLHDYAHESIALASPYGAREGQEALACMIACALVRIPDEPTELADVEAWYDYEVRGRWASPHANAGAAVLWELVKAGKVTLADVRAAHEAYEGEEVKLDPPTPKLCAKCGKGIANRQLPVGEPERCSSCSDAEVSA